ncbi:hypothetical protein OQH60_03690 [Campylobacter sp. MIT 21-1685]|uniref:hypothetical protein n=1 Tax=unclassified Campylobacter TaxID=2593542 RepID=UPI00224B6CEC|nr:MULTISPECIES: hypothetical protein [unclassified Campylobacter]MCX2682964.1 hypothetical protein [Campylobacter sp. MIT 21-1684]MCX2751246.1 hypothetical protein [Campylobacter sp. MIT 21-1682]MCX2807445.1 hypothetical protein [Campylobacter sp. MIT 21-1685]
MEIQNTTFTPTNRVLFAGGANCFSVFEYYEESFTSVQAETLSQKIISDTTSFIYEEKAHKQVVQTSHIKYRRIERLTREEEDSLPIFYTIPIITKWVEYDIKFIYDEAKGALVEKRNERTYIEVDADYSATRISLSQKKNNYQVQNPDCLKKFHNQAKNKLLKELLANA